MSKIDIERCEQAMRELDIRGIPDTPCRKKLIESAIGAIQANPADALKAEYFGIKNYAEFGDQRADCRYGYSPTHGSIVFKIGRRDRHTGPFSVDDCVYLLECVRDFGFFEAYDRGRNKDEKFNLVDAIKRYRTAESEARFIRTLIDSRVVETHDAA